MIPLRTLCMAHNVRLDKIWIEEYCVKKPSLLTVVLYGLCAVIWTLRAILEIAYQTYNDSVFWFVMNMLCAVIWIVAFIVNLKRYRSKQDG